LDEDGRVADEGGANCAAGGAVGRDWAWGGVDPFAPGAGFAVQKPSDKGSAAGRKLAARIVKKFAVKMIGWRAVVGFHRGLKWGALTL
jgi:hypothetical protein